jgi:uncharacterized protein YceH (UPF0502 family)
MEEAKAEAKPASGLEARVARLEEEVADLKAQIALLGS